MHTVDDIMNTKHIHTHTPSLSSSLSFSPFPPPLTYRIKSLDLVCMKELEKKVMKFVTRRCHVIECILETVECVVSSLIV